MELVIKTTSDGSSTLENTRFGATYHSHFGAIQESRHVFIQAGLGYLLMHQTSELPIRIFEFGFGTGLNAYLTRLYVEQQGIPVHYRAVEQYPVPLHIAEQLNYPAILDGGNLDDFLDLHRAGWDCDLRLSPAFVLHKQSGNGLEPEDAQSQYHLIYYDAFGPESQPELWTATALQRMTNALDEGGVFVTYCAKGEVRRSLIHLGLDIERLPGPPGKREMLRGVKPPQAS
ncbi:MAG: tRNA (5-methylaminomethyl-2-thiouridine)(34)-methyltransferase MnmD [Lewinellaceae bacterium]|nr:tRNA (5-methylaminomethyl-2-thiouridine)(34)-methyltransferase MnmD [Saprospiraceae bacterium]MCB9311462.1 tRNA (5-methylaminomethyl-2-thiouridine)(34)-methyltransferase MnmD [Lewinellaceae bacterium]HRW76162.1 tRNA (5-methylaminomethyl-2-thiouridine)(34)-methyltransferase MnmD [Saprospiraceae bacterium]